MAQPGIRLRGIIFFYSAKLVWKAFFPLKKYIYHLVLYLVNFRDTGKTEEMCKLLSIIYKEWQVEQQSVHSVFALAVHFNFQ